MSAEPWIVDGGAEVVEPHRVHLGSGEAAGLVRCSPQKVPGDGEDALAVLPVDDSTTVLAIADGLGGHAQGARAASIVVRALADAVAGLAGDPAGLRGALLDAVEAAQKEVLALGSGAGATLAAIAIGPEGAFPLHAGDSGVLVVGQRGALRLQTVLHSPTGYALEAGLIDEEQALAHDERHLISNFVGCEGMHLQVGEALVLRARDTVLVTSDGLLDNFSTAELVESIRRGPLERSAAQLAREARQRMAAPHGKPDDLSLLLFRRRPR